MDVEAMGDVEGFELPANDSVEVAGEENHDELDLFASMEATEAGAGFSSDELDSTIKVLKYLRENKTVYENKSLRELRGLIHGFTNDVHKMRKKKSVFNSKRDQKNRQKSHDLKRIKSCKLRNERINKLKQLMHEHAIPDGAIEFNNNILKDQDHPQEELNYSRSCYICKTRFNELHFFYDQLCPSCAAFNWVKRTQVSDRLSDNKYALVTGARVKIGFQICLKLLRNGCNVIATTRFPNDALKRYMAEKDYSSWSNRLRIIGIDFSNLNLVEAMCKLLLNDLTKLDIIINNACQTIQRPKEYYENFLKNEAVPNKLLYHTFNKSPGLLQSGDGEGDSEECGDLSLAAPPSSEQLLDVNQQPVDLRLSNSWLLKLAEISTYETIEVFSINTITPFIINARLKPLMVYDGNGADGCYVVNVSAMEGKFYRFKNANHPHTNMAKAALNMMTRTSASDYVKSNIYMNSVDTGWINDENPVVLATKIAEENNFVTPIDEIDAAARILDPVISGMNDHKCRTYGKFLKDYRETEW